jgi:hypothetical protein
MVLVWGIVNVCDRKVLPLDYRIGEEPVVMHPGIRLNGEKENSAGVPVESVHRSESSQPGAPLQADQQRALDMVSGRRYRHPVRLIRDEDLLVAVNDKRFLKRIGLRRHLLPIENGKTMAVGRILPQCRAVA